MTLDFLRDRRIVPAIGGALAILLGVGIAVGIMMRDHGSKSPPPASRGGLVVETGRDDASLDPARPLRCFVGGQFVGVSTLADCAKKNGVATRALDVGVDATGAVAAASDNGPVIQPLTPSQVQSTPIAPPPAGPQNLGGGAQASVAGGVAVALCWRHDPDWRKLPSELSLNACVQALFAGHCERPGEAAYGRWGDETLRLVPRRVEISADNRTFRPLVDQNAGCAIAPVG
jgi:hypothetical protein